MNSLSTTKGPSRENWVVPLLTTLIVYIGLFLLLPYTSGYKDSRVSVFSIAYEFWTNYEDWQHGVIVPFIAIGMIWFYRKDLGKIPIKGANSGFVLLLLAFGVFWIGYVIDHHYVGFIAAQLLIAALIVWFLGWRMMRALFFPWAFLTFTWPFLFLDNYLAFPLRMLLADLSFTSLSALGIPCVKIGSAVVSAPNYALGLPAASRFAVDIADPCSGIRSLFALMMASAVYGFFTTNVGWKRLVLFACAIPFAIIGNCVRILILTLGTLVFGAEFAIGSLEHPTAFHMMAGFLVFAVALGAMILTGTALNTNWPTVWADFRKKIQLTSSVRSPITSHPASAAGPPQQDLY